MSTDQPSRRERQQQRRRRREQIAGAVVVVLGIVVAVVAIIALQEPSGHNRAGSTPSGTVTLTKAPTSSASSASPTRSSSSPRGSSGSSGTSSSSSSSQTSAPAGKKPLVVLNDTDTKGLAKNAAATFSDGGWTVTSFGNLPGDISDIISTCAYYDPDVTGTKAAAEALRTQFPSISRVQPKFDGLPDGPIVVVLTPDYSAN